jgi:hypothetical protein
MSKGSTGFVSEERLLAGKRKKNDKLDAQTL